jgi:hypothetical protein
MATCPTCQHEVSMLFYSFDPAVFLQNMVRSPANRIYTCRNCGERLTMSMSGFIFLQVVFVATVIPCAVAFARLQLWLRSSFGMFRQLSTEFPIMTVVLLWILPTLAVTLLVCSRLAKYFVEFRKAA